MYACETTQGDEGKLLTFERKLKWKIHEPARNLSGEYERRKKKDLEKLYKKN